MGWWEKWGWLLRKQIASTLIRGGLGGVIALFNLSLLCSSKTNQQTLLILVLHDVAGSTCSWNDAYCFTSDL